MNIMKVTKTIVRLTADEGKWLTMWTEEQDIIAFAAFKTVNTNEKQSKKYYEITDAEKEALDARKQIAEAVDIETPTEE